MDNDEMKEILEAAEYLTYKIENLKSYALKNGHIENLNTIIHYFKNDTTELEQQLKSKYKLSNERFAIIINLLHEKAAMYAYPNHETFKTLLQSIIAKKENDVIKALVIVFDEFDKGVD